MTKFLTIASLLFSGIVSAQVAKLEVRNPGPRAGDDVDVIVTLSNPEDVESTKDQANILDQQIARGSITFRHVVADTGMIRIGPFCFQFNGTTFTTDAISLRVFPRLPEDAKDGIWMRVLQFNNESYLIVEQRAAINWKEQKSDNEWSVSADDHQYASLDEDKFESTGLNIITSSSYSGSYLLNNNEPIGSRTVHYKCSTYKFEKTLAFQGKIKLDKKYFVDFPAKGLTEEVWIK